MSLKKVSWWVNCTVKRKLSQKSPNYSAGQGKYWLLKWTVPEYFISVIWKSDGCKCGNSGAGGGGGGGNGIHTQEFITTVIPLSNVSEVTVKKNRYTWDKNSCRKAQNVSEHKKTAIKILHHAPGDTKIIIA